jgi:predicted peptidase
MDSRLWFLVYGLCVHVGQSMPDKLLCKLTQSFQKSLGLRRIMKNSFFLFFVFSISVIPASAQQVAKVITTADGSKIGFLEAKPADYGKKKHPLIIFLHGIDERGNGTSEIMKVASHGLPKLLKNTTLQFNGETFIVLSPQLSKAYGAWEVFYIDEMLRYAKTLQVDTNRIYLTGISIGGGAVWGYCSISEAHAKQFAAIAPLCAACYYDYQKLDVLARAGTPVWAFVGSADKTVSPTCTLQAVDAINAANKKKPAKETVYKGLGHNVWDRAYDPGNRFHKPNLYEWLLQHKRQ